MPKDEVTEEQALWEILGSLLVGAFVGFFVIVALGNMLLIIAYITGGLVAGLIARGGMGRGALAGFISGMFGGIAVTDRTLGLISLMGLEGMLGGFLGGIIGGILGKAIGRVRIKHLQPDMHESQKQQQNC